MHGAMPLALLIDSFDKDKCKTTVYWFSTILTKWLYSKIVTEWMLWVIQFSQDAGGGGEKHQSSRLTHLAIGWHLHFLAHDLFYTDWLRPQSQINKILKRKVVFSPKGEENITSFLFLFGWRERHPKPTYIQRTRTHSLFRLALTH